MKFPRNSNVRMNTTFAELIGRKGKTVIIDAASFNGAASKLFGIIFILIGIVGFWEAWVTYKASPHDMKDVFFLVLIGAAIGGLFTFTGLLFMFLNRDIRRSAS